MVVASALVLFAGCAPETAPAEASTEPSSDDRLAWDEPMACVDPRPAVAYDEVGAAWGFTGPDLPDAAERVEGGGFVVDDLDRDGDLDFVFTFEEADLRVFRQQAGAVVEERIARSDPGVPSLADLDSDGWNDVVLTGKGLPVLHNQAGQLVLAGEIGRGGRGVREVAPADLDGDGDLDLVVVARAIDEEASRDSLLWNDGALALRYDLDALDATVASRKGFDAIVFDWEGDGTQDVYVVNDMGATYGPNVLWHNEGGTFSAAGAACTCDVTMVGMGGSIGDFDGDGAPDLYLTGDTNVLLQGRADGTFVDTTVTTGANPIDDADGMAWGSAWLDYDNDGETDVLVGRGDFGPGHAVRDYVAQPLHLLRQEEGVLRDVAPALGIGVSGSWRGVLPVDINTDGVLDLVVHSMDTRPLVFLSQGCTEASWLGVEAPIGSVVRVEAGGRTWTAWVTSDVGYGAGRTPQAWFGLGEAAEIDRLEVTLPWGAGALVAEGPIAARRWVRVGAAASAP